MSNKVYLFSATPHLDAIHINSLDFDFFQPKIDFSSLDYLILTSKKAVDALQFYDVKEYINIPALCISKFTKEYYESFGGKVFAVGGGIGSDLQQIISTYPKEKKWLYLRAKEIAGEGFATDEAIVYASRCSDEILDFTLDADEECFLVFTSPSSIKCFLKNNSFSPHHKIVVIGKTTAKNLPNGVNYKVAKQNSIIATIELTQQWDKD